MKRIIFFLLLQVSFLVCFADEYRDPVSNVIYTYEPTGGRAEVKSGVYLMFDGGDNDVIAVPGSPDAKAEIIILDKFIVDEKEYIVDKIGSCAFLLKDNVVSVTIPSSVNTIGSEAFYGCANLSNISLEEGLASIGALAFCDCTSLDAIILPEGLKTIKNGAFKDTGLTSITIPSTVQNIGDAVFFFSPIKTIISLIEEPFKVPQICQQQNEVTLRVPVGSKLKYETTSSWNQFLTIEEIQPTAIVSPIQHQITSCFDLQGRKLLRAPQKGIYIQNRKKVAVK